MHPAFTPLVELDVQFPLTRAAFEELGVQGLQSGCGSTLRPGWLNSDWRSLHDGDRDHGRRTVPERLYRVRDDRWFIQHAVPEPFPIEAESLDRASAEDFLEHLRPEDGIAWLTEMHRVLAPGGLLRVVVPDLRKYIAGYVDPSDPFMAEHARALEPHFPDRAPLERRAFIVNKIFYGWGHKWMYDFDELRHAAVAAGFRAGDVTRHAFREGSDPELAAFDLGEHSFESLYVEIAKS
jgi:predicted SAM-dependent methyltransferase